LIEMEIKNRKAYHDYEILDKIEAGVVLHGHEVKSVREGGANLKDSFAKIDDKDQVWLNGMSISPYKNSPERSKDPERPKKLLLKKSEIRRLHRRVLEKGLTLVPTRMYFSRGYVKVEIGLARGKRQYDKRKTIAAKDAERDMERSMKDRD
jgi:SsrA-binding protein